MALRTSSTRYNTRTAQANAAAQSARYQQNIAAGQQKLVKDARSQLKNDIASKPNATQDEINTFNSRNTALTNMAYKNDATAQNATQNLSQATQELQQRGLTDLAGDKGYKTATNAAGKVELIGTGRIQQSAIDNLRKKGFADDQIIQRLEELKPQIQSTISNTGLGGTFDSKGMFVPPTQDPKNRAADAGTAAANNLRSAGVLDPKALAEASEAATRAEQAKIDSENAAQDREQQKSKENAMSNAASNAAAGEQSQQEGEAGMGTSPEQAGSSSVIASLPPELQGVGQLLQGIIDQNQADQTKLFNDQMGRLDEAYDSIDQQIKKTADVHESTAKGIQEILDKSLNTQNDAIEQQKNAELERLEWDRQREEQRIAKAKTKDLDQRTAALALAGGFGSLGGQNEIAESQAMFDQMFSDVQREVGVRRTEIGAKFTQLHNEVYENYHSAGIKNLENLTASLERVTNQSIASTDARARAENDVIKSWVEQTQKNRTDLANGLMGIYEKGQQAINQKKDDDRADKKDALSMWERHIANYGNTNPKAAKKLISYMGSLGWDTSMFDANAPTMSQIEKASENSMEDALSGASGKYILYKGKMVKNPNYGTTVGESYVDPTSQIDLAAVLRDSVAKFTATAAEGRVEEGLKYLREGKIDAFRNLVMNSVNNKGFDADTSKSVTSRIDILKAFDSVRDKLKDVSKRDWGLYEAITQGSIKYLPGGLKNPLYLQVKAEIQMAQSVLRNQMFGAALTDTESAIANDFLVSFSDDRVGDMLKKMNGTEESIERFVETRYDQLLGNGTYKNFLKKAGTVSSMPSPMDGVLTGDDADSWFEEGMYNSGSEFRGTGASFQWEDVDEDTLPKVNSQIRTGIIDGTITGYGSKYWMPGLDIAAPLGSPVRSQQKGKIVSVVSQYDQGYPNDNAKGKAQNSGFGNQVVVKFDDGTTGYFSHLQGTDFDEDMVGERVSPGQILGYVGNTGNTYGKTGIHLDMTVKDKNGKYLTAKQVAAWMGLSSIHA